jgi:hypothetical protein
MNDDAEDLLRQGLAAIRSSDTFAWLTTDVPQGLETWGARRRMMLTTWKHEVDGPAGDVWENTQRKRVVARATAELDMQVASLAKVLRGSAMPTERSPDGARP